MSLQRVISVLIPRETHFFDFLEHQARIARQSTRVLGRFIQGDPDHAAIRRDVTAFEKEGDGIVDEMLVALSKTFVTPVDREDLQALSKRLDDVTDYVNTAARSIGIFAVQQASPAMGRLYDTLLQACDQLNEMVPLLRKGEYGQIIDQCRKMHLTEKLGDKIFRNELSRMFHDPDVSGKEILRSREILDNLETAIDACDRVAEAMMHIAIKHS
jgi:predicted phosphate transport protein (TIGR00153 family)